MFSGSAEITFSLLALFYLRVLKHLLLWKKLYMIKIPSEWWWKKYNSYHKWLIWAVEGENVNLNTNYVLCKIEQLLYI